jgi:hypothetical protein
LLLYYLFGLFVLCFRLILFGPYYLFDLSVQLILFDLLIQCFLFDPFDRCFLFDLLLLLNQLILLSQLILFDL